MCTNSELKTVLGKVRDESEQIYGAWLDKIILYGSYARGDNTEESDIDIMILLDCSTDEETLEKYAPDVIAVNCCEATTPYGRLIMNLSDVEAVCRQAPKALVVATHLDSVNHALITSREVKDFAQEHGLKNLSVPQNGGQLLLC